MNSLKPIRFRPTTWSHVPCYSHNNCIREIYTRESSVWHLKILIPYKCTRRPTSGGGGGHGHVGCISKRFTISQCRSYWLKTVYFGSRRSSSSTSGPPSNASGFESIPNRRRKRFHTLMLTMARSLNYRFRSRFSPASQRKQKVPWVDQHGRIQQGTRKLHTLRKINGMDSQGIKSK